MRVQQPGLTTDSYDYALTDMMNSRYSRDPQSQSEQDPECKLFPVTTLFLSPKSVSRSSMHPNLLNGDCKFNFSLLLMRIEGRKRDSGVYDSS